jgi:hypothetical protein
MTNVLAWGITIVQYGLSFYGFWLVWRVLLPVLPGPRDPSDRVVPYVWYFTDPFVVPVAKALHAPTRLVAFVALAIVAAVSVALGEVPELA